MKNFVSNSGFICHPRFLELFIYKCNFNSNFFRNSLFYQQNIYYPNILEQSVNIRKAEFLAGRFCASKCLSELNITDFEIKTDKNRCPLWPAGLNGSITHSKSTAIAAVSAQPSVLGVGIDIEDIFSSIAISEIKEQVLFGNEFSLFDASEVSRKVLFSLVFSIKESFFKAAYPSTGYYFDFDAVRIDSLDFRQNQFELTLCQDLNPILTKDSTYTGCFKIMDDQIFSILVLKKKAKPE